MSKKKKKGFRFPNILSGLREETVHGVFAVVFFACALFFILAALNLAGIAGSSTYSALKTFLGIGYFLLPILLLMLAVTYAGSLDERLGISRGFGSLLFFLSGLATIDLIESGQGGLVGHYISGPLSLLFDKATIIILAALLIISVLIIFDLHFSLSPLKKLASFFLRKKPASGDMTIDDRLFEDVVEEEKEDDEYEEEDEDEGENPDEISKKSFVGTLFGIKKKSGEFRVVNTGKTYVPPPLSLLEKDKGKPNVGDVKANANIIKRTFHNFGIQVEMDEVSIGPTVTRYALKPAEGVRLSRILGLQNNLELALAAHPVRIEAPIPGRALVGIEVPNAAKATVGMAGILSDNAFTEATKALVIGLGRDIAGDAHFADLGKMPHCLIAGATGSGKSVMIHALVTSLLFRNSPEQLRFLMIDPKRVELTLYNSIPHLLAPVITDAKKTILALKWAAREMDRRYDILESESVRDVESYHKNILAPKLTSTQTYEEGEDVPDMMPYIVIIIDELADIMQAYPRELESAVVRLAQMSRAVGIHLVLSTQRPSVNVITGLIKANIPSRIALQVASQIDSRTILDMSGAEKLLGAGDMLYLSGDMGKPRRIQAPYISENEVKKVVQYLKKNYEDELPNTVEFTNGSDNDAIFSASLDDDQEDDDPLYEQAREIVIHAGKASTSYLQRKLRIGYSRAARLIDILEKRGVIGPQDGSKARGVIGEHGEDGYDDEDDKDMSEEKQPNTEEER